MAKLLAGGAQAGDGMVSKLADRNYDLRMLGALDLVERGWLG